MPSFSTLQTDTPQANRNLDSWSRALAGRTSRLRTKLEAFVLVCRYVSTIAGERRRLKGKYLAALFVLASPVLYRSWLRAIRRQLSHYYQSAVYRLPWLLSDPQSRGSTALAENLVCHGAKYQSLAVLAEIAYYSSAAMRCDIRNIAYSDLFTSTHRELAEAVAERSYQTALAINPDCAAAHFNFASLMAERNPRVAAAHFNIARQLQKYYDPHVELRLAAMHERQGRRSEAAQCRRRAYSMDVDLGQLHASFAEELRRDGAIDLALPAFGRSLDYGQFHVPEFLVLDPSRRRAYLQFLDDTSATVYDGLG